MIMPVRRKGIVEMKEDKNILEGIGNPNLNRKKRDKLLQKTVKRRLNRAIGKHIHTY